MGEDDDRLVRRELGQVGPEPGQLRLAEDRRRVRGVVEYDEVNALVVEGIAQAAVSDTDTGEMERFARALVAGP